MEDFVLLQLPIVVSVVPPTCLELIAYPEELFLLVLHLEADWQLLLRSSNGRVVQRRAARLECSSISKQTVNYFPRSTTLVDSLGKLQSKN